MLCTATDGFALEVVGMNLRFCETRLHEEPHRLRLLGPSNEVLLALSGTEIDDAVRAGFLDRDSFHFSMYEYAKIRALTPTAPAPEPAAICYEPAPSSGEDFDRTFLQDLKIRWE
jgi:hypothetical protein